MVIKSFKEYQRKYFPNEILDRLLTELCGYEDLTEEYQYRISKSKENPKEGFLEIAKNPLAFHSNRKNIEDLLKNFYREEGFSVEQGKIEKFPLCVSNNEEKYSIYIQDTEDSWSISVMPFFS